MTLTSSQKLALQNGRISHYQIPMDRCPSPFLLHLSAMLIMCTLNPVNKSRMVNVSDHEVPMYVRLTPVQQAHIAKYALANGNKASASTLT